MNELSEILEGEKTYVAKLISGDYSLAKEIARDAVIKIRAWLDFSPNYRSEGDLEVGFYIGIFFRALFDFAAIQELVSAENWHQKTTTVEKVWEKLWDCRERLTFCESRIQGQTIEGVRTNLDDLDRFYMSRFGPGQYASPEILMKRAVCSICNEDIQRCIHIGGRVYAGKLCAAVPEPLAMESVSIVNVPRDPRCRIWPWKFDGEKVAGMKILSIFRIDDFTDSDEWR